MLNDKTLIKESVNLQLFSDNIYCSGLKVVLAYSGYPGTGAVKL